MNVTSIRPRGRTAGRARSWVRWGAMVWGCLCGVMPLIAQKGLPLEIPITVTSRSGQFVVHSRGTELPAPPESLSRVGTNAMISLRADLLAVTAERVKRAIEQRLDTSDPWQARIHLQLIDSARFGGRISIRPQLFGDGWQYSVPLPDRIEWDRLVRTLVEVVLLERANRSNNNPECALVPLWLTEGITQLLLAEEGRDLVAEAATYLNRSRVKPDPLATVRATLRGREPMTFSELGLVSLDQLAEEALFRDFRASAALLTWEFLRDETGRLATRKFLQQLSAHLNWQTAFLRAWGEHFSTLLEVEKWWAVAAADTLSAGPSQRWPREQILTRLADLLVETAEVRADTNSPAVQKRVPVSEVVGQWEFATQRDVLRRKISQLRALTQRAPPDLVALPSDYARVLDDYVRTRERAGTGATGRGELEARGNLLAAATRRRLAELDRRLAAERTRSIPAGPAPVNLRGATNSAAQFVPSRS